MRLVNAYSYRLEEFYGDEIPPYICLSHTWVHGEEPSYLDWSAAYDEHQQGLPPRLSRRQQELRERMKVSMKQRNKLRGFEKIVAFLEKIRSRNNRCEKTGYQPVQYGWADTISVDKSSSTEVSEAINSMFGIYRDCEICYAYLIDLDESKEPNPSRLIEEFSLSRWFSRGWTLPELIAPPKLYFYETNWGFVGSRRSLSRQIKDATGIGETALSHYAQKSTHLSVAERMSWASRRKTTKAEDIAYCLLGIFDVNMPLLYGEGAAKAFVRLQEEIIKKTDDDSLFAWKDRSLSTSDVRGLFATSPAHFADGGDISFPGSTTEEPFLLTNKGLRIRAKIVPMPATIDTLDLLMILDSEAPNGKYTSNICIRLRRLTPDGWQFVRVACDTTMFSENSMHGLEPCTIFVRDRPLIPKNYRSSHVRGIMCVSHKNRGFQLKDIAEWNCEKWPRGIKTGFPDSSSLKLFFPDSSLAVNKRASQIQRLPAICIRLQWELHDRSFAILQIDYNPRSDRSVKSGQYTLTPRGVLFTLIKIKRRWSDLSQVQNISEHAEQICVIEEPVQPSLVGEETWYVGDCTPTFYRPWKSRDKVFTWPWPWQIWESD